MQWKEAPSAYVETANVNENVRGRVKMATSNRKACIHCDIHKVWDIVLAVDKYHTWRSDVRETNVLNEKQFIEYTNDGYSTTFTVTAVEPYERWEFDIENSNMKGHWIGRFTPMGDITELDITESVIPKKVFMKPFVKAYLKKQQNQFITELKKSLEE